ncbi:cytochrome P450 [Auricularia subglabra TFB-10046 SS5]|nr:cytochrome P450 [Auricularia subglabra TFB-10046 SS5]
MQSLQKVVADIDWQRALDAAAVAAAAGLATTVLYKALFARRQRLPPGPKPKFLIGNAHQMPRTEGWKTYYRWAQEFGDVVYLNVVGRSIVILSSFKAVSELLGKRAAIYSDRPVLWFYGKLMARETAAFNMSSEDRRFKVYRRILQGSLNPRTAREYWPIQQHETHVMLQRVLEQPDNFWHLVRRNTVAVIMRIAYGYAIERDDDPFVSTIDESIKLAGAGSQPGRWLVDSFPSLRFVPSWFPGGKFQKIAKEWGAQLDRMTRAPYEWTRAQIAGGTARPCFVSEHLQDADEDAVVVCAAALYAGAADTVAATMTAFFKYMIEFPEVQRRAQEEIDRVIGKDRLPNMDDRESLPYVRNLIKELLRLAPPAPLGLPHSLIRDDEYNGYILPKNSIVYANIWALMHDKDTYPEPFVLNPDRHAGPSPPPDPQDWVFGFGYRICPGLHFAEATLFLGISNMLATLNVGPAADGSLPSDEFSTGIVSHPKPFKCSITARRPGVVTLIDGLVDRGL